MTYRTRLTSTDPLRFALSGRNLRPTRNRVLQGIRKTWPTLVFVFAAIKKKFYLVYICDPARDLLLQFMWEWQNVNGWLAQYRGRAGLGRVLVSLAIKRLPSRIINESRGFWPLSDLLFYFFSFFWTHIFLAMPWTSLVTWPCEANWPSDNTTKLSKFLFFRNLFMNHRARKQSTNFQDDFLCLFVEICHTHMGISVCIMLVAELQR